MTEQTAVVIGASGLIGSHLVHELLLDNFFKKVIVLVRNKLAIDHSKLQQEIVNFNDINDYTDKFGNGDIIFCCVGTTSKKVNGDIKAYEKVDFDIPYNAGKIGMAKNFKKILIVLQLALMQMPKTFI